MRLLICMQLLLHLLFFLVQPVNLSPVRLHFLRFLAQLVLQLRQPLGTALGDSEIVRLDRDAQQRVGDGYPLCRRVCIDRHTAQLPAGFGADVEQQVKHDVEQLV